MASIVPNIEDTVEANSKLLNQQPHHDKILHSEVSLQLGEEMSIQKVTTRNIGPGRILAGTYNEDPYLSSLMSNSKSTRPT